jgi:hypothetical protein
MQKEEPKLTPELIKYIGDEPIGKVKPFQITNYQSLVQKIAHLAYLNKNSLLFFRGQTQDFKNKAGVSTFYPSIYREDNLRQSELMYQFEKLENASRQLKEIFNNEKISGANDLSKKKYIQWSILQHYNVCKTPLLDFTQSLRVACSFAQMDNSSETGFVYVFGLPYITNRISINSEHEIVNIRLLSICPPDALRPYFQEGYLAGTPDITYDYEAKVEMDFTNRLIAKFEIPITKTFWGRGNNRISNAALFPKADKIEKICKTIKIQIPNQIHPGAIGEFITAWSPLEEYLVGEARSMKDKPLSISEAIHLLEDNKRISKQEAYKIDEIRKFRNQVVHQPISVNDNEVNYFLNNLKILQKEIFEEQKNEWTKLL